MARARPVARAARLQCRCGPGERPAATAAVPAAKPSPAAASHNPGPSPGLHGSRLRGAAGLNREGSEAAGGDVTALAPRSRARPLEREGRRWAGAALSCCKGKRRRCPRADSGKLLRPRSAPTRCRSRARGRRARTRARWSEDGRVFFFQRARGRRGAWGLRFFSFLRREARASLDGASGRISQARKQVAGDRSIPEKVLVLSRYGIPGPTFFPPPSCSNK